MISVLASIRIQKGKRDAFLEIFNANVPKVRQEAGCLDYFPAVDIDAALPAQLLDEDVVTVIEKWQDLEALTMHLSSPHMLAYREQVKDLVQEVSIKILQPA